VLKIAGNKLEFQNGVLRKIDGIDLYKEKLAPIEIEKRNKIISSERAISLLNNYTKKVSTIGTSLSKSATSGEIGRLKELQNKRNLTLLETTEKQKLQKSVASNYKKASEMIGLSMAVSVLSLGIGSAKLASQLYINPVATIKTLPKNMWIGLKEDFARARGSGTGALNVAVEYITLVGVLKGIGVLGKSTIRTVSKLHPKYAKLVDGKIVLRKAPAEIFKIADKEKFLKTRVLNPSIIRPFSSVADFLKGKKPGQFKKFTKDPGLILKEQTVTTGSTPLSKQVLLAGKEVTAVNASANQLTSWLGRKKIIRKPFNLTGLEKKFPKGEKSFPIKIKRILNKFDSGIKLTTKEFAEVNLWLQKNIVSNITLLERSLYLDPASGLRISRLGIKKSATATLKDILKGNFRLWEKAGKPQVLIFERLRVGKIPKNSKKHRK